MLFANIGLTSLDVMKPLHTSKVTDDKVQAMVRAEFADATVITIAHRLNTIIDYDRILIMDDGT